MVQEIYTEFIRKIMQNKEKLEKELVSKNSFQNK